MVTTDSDGSYEFDLAMNKSHHMMEKSDKYVYNESSIYYVK